ncbi:MAG: hypothetical protein ACSNEK_05675 [Parachlamydiaceae bacterium]
MGSISGMTIRQCEGLLTKGKATHPNRLSRLWENCKVAARRIFYLLTQFNWVSDKRLARWTIFHLETPQQPLANKEQQKVVDFLFKATSRACPTIDVSKVNFFEEEFVCEPDWTVDQNLNNLQEFVLSKKTLNASQLLKVLVFAENLKDFEQTDPQKERLFSLMKRAFSECSLKEAREYSKDLNLKRYFLLFHYEFIMERFLASETLNLYLLQAADNLNLEKSQQAKSKRRKRKLRKEFLLTAQARIFRHEQLPLLTLTEKLYYKRIVRLALKFNQEENYTHFLDLIKDHPQTVREISKIVGNKKKALLTSEEIKLIFEELKKLRDKKVASNEFEVYMLGFKRSFNNKQFRNFLVQNNLKDSNWY